MKRITDQIKGPRKKRKEMKKRKEKINQRGHSETGIKTRIKRITD